MSQIENKVERRGKDKDDGLVVDVELEHRSSYEKIKGKGVNALPSPSSMSPQLFLEIS